MEQLDTKKNLCSECCYPYPECPATENDVIFGDGVGNDNICYCEKMVYKFNLFDDRESLDRTLCGGKNEKDY